MSLCIENLRESNDFLNTLLDNVEAAVLLVDPEASIHHFNDVFLKIFGKEFEEVAGQRCGNAMGCFYTVEEGKLCGETSHCSQCPLRQSIIKSFTRKVPVRKARMTRRFMLPQGYQVKHVEYSTQHVAFRGQEMIIVIIYDVTELENQRAALARRTEQLEQDLRSAAVIQKSLLPQDPSFLRHAAFEYSFKPCESVGGDILHLFPLPGDKLGAYMLDVAGHGAPAAMLAVCVHQRMHPTSGLVADLSQDPPRVLDPEAALEALDAEFPFDRFETHFTICYAVLDLDTGRLACSNAAHPKPVVLGPDGGLTVLERSGGIIGLGCYAPFGCNDVTMKPGSRLIMVTDGILEHGPDSANMFGFERYAETLKLNAQASLREQLDAVMAAAEDFALGAPVKDDMTMFGLEYLGKEGTG